MYTLARFLVGLAAWLSHARVISSFLLFVFVSLALSLSHPVSLPPSISRVAKFARRAKGNGRADKRGPLLSLSSHSLIVFYMYVFIIRYNAVNFANQSHNAKPRINAFFGKFRLLYMCVCIVLIPPLLLRRIHFNSTEQHSVLLLCECPRPTCAANNNHSISFYVNEYGSSSILI